MISFSAGCGSAAPESASMVAHFKQTAIARPTPKGELRSRTATQFAYYKMLSTERTRNDGEASYTGRVYIDYRLVESPEVVETRDFYIRYAEVDAPAGGSHGTFEAAPGDQVRVWLQAPEASRHIAYVDPLDFALAYAQGYPSLGGQDWDISQPRQLLCPKLGSGSKPTTESYNFNGPNYGLVAAGPWVTIPPLPSATPSPSTAPSVGDDANSASTSGSSTVGSSADTGTGTGGSAGTDSGTGGDSGTTDGGQETNGTAIGTGVGGSSGTGTGTGGSGTTTGESGSFPSGDGPSLHVIQVETLDPRAGGRTLAALGASEDIDPSRDLDIFGLLRLLKVHDLGTSQTYWSVLVNGVSTSRSDSSLTLTLQSQTSQRAVSVELAHQGGSFYAASFDANALQLINENLPGTGYTATDPVGRGVIASRFMLLFGNLAQSVATIFPSPRTSLGRYMPYDSFAAGTVPSTRPKNDEALASLPNVITWGFEVLRLSVEPSRNPGLTQSLEAIVKVKHQAKVVSLNGHGGTDAKIMLDLGGPWPPPEYILDPRSLTPSQMAKTKTLVFNSCNVLGLNDYNGEHYLPSVPLAERLSPGKLWHGATGRNTVLLGYNFPNRGMESHFVLPNFAAELARLSSLQVDESKVQQLAWMSANLKANQASPSTLVLALTACAWDSDSYYYISYSPSLSSRAPSTASPEGEPPPPTSREVYGIYRVPLVGSDNQSTKAASPPTGGGVELVKIP